jgi:hypothetical protein
MGVPRQVSDCLAKFSGRSPQLRTNPSPLSSCPVSLVLGASFWLTIPNDFPHQGRSKIPVKASVWAIDFMGVFLLVAAMILTLTGLEQAASTLDWTAAKTLAPLCTSVVPWAAFLARQYAVTSERSPVEPIFPWRFFHNRIFLGLLGCVAHSQLLPTCLADSITDTN